MTDEPLRRPQLSVVIASYNSARWLPSTIGSLLTALERSTIAAEIVVVDDGSTDDTAAVLAELAATSPVPIRVVAQENRGRFLARWEGAQAALADRLLVFDSRLLMGADSLAHLQATEASSGYSGPWNGHVPTDPSAPLVGRFWEVPTHIFWGDYLAHPAPTEITLENFDRVPKGTGCLVIDRELFLEACRVSWPEGDARLVSDDTKLLRFVCEQHPLRLDPGFNALYRPRTTVRGFLGHAYDRGTLFVDSYAGTSAARDVVLIALAIVPLLALAALVVSLALGAWWAAAVIVALIVVGITVPAVAGAIRQAPGRAVAAYFTYVVPFGAVFWAGLVRGLSLRRRSAAT